MTQHEGTGLRPLAPGGRAAAEIEECERRGLDHSRKRSSVTVRMFSILRELRGAKRGGDLLLRSEVETSGANQSWDRPVHTP